LLGLISLNDRERAGQHLGAESARLDDSSLQNIMGTKLHVIAVREVANFAASPAKTRASSGQLPVQVPRTPRSFEPAQSSGLGLQRRKPENSWITLLFCNETLSAPAVQTSAIRIVGKWRDRLSLVTIPRAAVRRSQIVS
jgi:hypothetical protein